MQADSIALCQPASAAQPSIPGLGSAAGPAHEKAMHEKVMPRASYSPWNLDDEFRRTYAAVQQHTLVDMYRCWELWTLVEQTCGLPGCVMEVGVWRGGTGALLAKQESQCGGSRPVYLCDTFAGVVKAGENDPDYRGGEHDDTSKAIVDDLLHAKLGLSNYRLLEGVFPEETAAEVETEVDRVRLCHIDVDVYQSAKDVNDWVWPRLPIGGVVVYDDYGFRKCHGVTRLVDEQRVLADRLIVHNLNGHALVVKIA